MRVGLGSTRRWIKRYSVVVGATVRGVADGRLVFIVGYVRAKVNRARDLLIFALRVYKRPEGLNIRFGRELNFVSVLCILQYTEPNIQIARRRLS